MKRLLLAIGVIVAVQATASAQNIGQFDPEDAVAPVSIVEGPGVKVGEGTVLHPIFGLETGFVSNVFYQDTNVTGAGLLRVMGQIGAGSLPLDRLAPPVLTSTVDSEAGQDPSGVIKDEGDFIYRADLRLSYDALLSGNEVVRGTGGLGIGSTLRGLVNPLHTWQFGFNDDYHRLIRAANFETDADTNRDINALSLRLFFQPTDNRFSGILHYENVIDVFEKDTQHFANRFQNTFGLRMMYQWLPVTRMSLNVSQGVYTGLGASTKVSSYPLKATVGIETLLGLSTTLTAYAGVTKGWYASGPDFLGPLLGVNFGYRYSPLGRIVLEYMWMYEDSVNANFYRDHVVRGWLQQAYVPFVFVVQPEIHFREYDGITIVNGPPTRNDFIVAVSAGIHYNLRNWIAFTADYRFTAVQTDYRYMVNGVIDDPSYVRHELLLGTRLAM
jgi:hypothetical protein